MKSKLQYICSSDEREQLEQELLQQVRATAQAYRNAVAQTKMVQERHSDLVLGHPDGTLARIHAAMIEKEALDKYAQAVKAFGNFLLHGVRPPCRHTPLL